MPTSVNSLVLTKEEREALPVRRFEVVQGKATEGGMLYEKGEIIETKNDLAKMFGKNKFREIGGKNATNVTDGTPIQKRRHLEDSPQEAATQDRMNEGEGDDDNDPELSAPSDDGLEEMTKAELVDLAKDESIEVHASATKKEIVGKIRSSREQG